MTDDTQRFYSAYPRSKRIAYTMGAILFGVVVAGFWNYQLVDGFGREVIAGNMIGDTGALATSYSVNGGGFGLLFAAIAGLAATFTACNCVVFAMIPGLACSTDQAGAGRKNAWKAFLSFTIGVLVISGAYGVYVGFLGTEGVEMLNERAVRMAQAQAVFTLLGLSMLIWGVMEMGYLNKVTKRFSETTRAFFNQTTTKALLLGAMVGMFAVGRPFPVFREFLVYAGSAQNPVYGGIVMMVQGIGQITVMAILFFAIVWLAGDKIGRVASEKPYKFRVISGSALLVGGTYFVFYWGLAFLFDIGRWGFNLGLY